MKRLLVLLLMLALTLGVSASAEVVGHGPEGVLIHRYTAPNGQELFFLADMENPPITQEDVNGDGLDDLVIATTIGASNAWYTFFLQQADGQYVQALCAYDLINYSVHDGYVLSWGTNGMAGALFDAVLLRWEGTDLYPVRILRSVEKTDTAFVEDKMVTTTYLETFHAALWDCHWTRADDGTPIIDEDTLLWEQDFDTDHLMAEEGVHIFDEMYQRLWEGLNGEDA